MFSLKQVRPKVFLLHFDQQYDVTMHFLRYQEYYESPVWRNKIFCLLEYMDWYSKEYGKGAFSYTTDWGGFNIPSSVLDEVNPEVIPDFNGYDEFMHCMAERIRREIVDDTFYLIGTYGDDSGHLDHEISHAYYYLYPEYKKLQILALGFGGPEGQPFPKGTKTWQDQGRQVLLEQGYCEEVLKDELIAYAATGPTKDLEPHLGEAVAKIASENFKEFDARIVEKWKPKALAPVNVSTTK